MPTSIAKPWSPAQRWSFRFFFCYLLLYFFPLPSGLAGPEFLSSLLDPFWHAVVPWVGEHVLHLEHPITTFSNGSGDTTYDYVRILCMAAIAALATVVWSALARRRPDHGTVYAWGRLWLRYALAIAILGYGLAKVIKLQFPTPSYSRLTETYGESSPMGLLWTFMGFSTGYTFFCGLCETAAGLLLFFRRTTLAGAMLATAAMVHVAALNFFYDVPVKLGSLHLLLAAVVLVLPDAGRLANLFFLNRPTEPAPEPALVGPVPQRIGVVLKILIIGAVLTSELSSAVSAYRGAEGRRHPKRPDGWYAVTSFVEDGNPLPPLATPSPRWKTFVLLQGYVRLWGFDRSTRLFKVSGDPTSGPFDLLPIDDNNQPIAGAPPLAHLTLVRPMDDTPRLEGTFEGKAIEVDLRVENLTDFPLMKRGFHWINEVPYNR